ncbi:MAG TPA: OB-fold domain-containing protein [Thermoplasmata archaeon]|nr:OB-fold domain-containing protein [Thermoplasmata archaeon]
MSAPGRPRRPVAVVAERPPEPAPAAPAGPPAEKGARKLPFLLDFYPLQSERETRLARFYARLAEGRVATTRCATDGWMWPPRVVCPTCHTDRLEWADLPEGGRIYAFSAVLAGAPLGMESEVPFAVGLVDLDGVPLRLFGRIEGRPWTALAIGARVRLEPYAVGDGRFFYRFRADEPPADR